MQKGKTPETLKESNRILILNCLRLQGDMSRADLCRNLEMSFPTISSNVKGLIDDGYIKEVGVGDNSLGRKSTLLAFHADRGYVIGMDLGRFRTRVMLSDLSGNKIASLWHPTNTEGGSDGIIRVIVDSVLEVVDKGGKERTKVLGICIGTPGVIKENSIMLAPFLPNIPILELKEKLNDLFSAEILIENSINLGALGENWKGAGRSFKNFTFINYGVGVGAAVIINGELYKGSNNAAGEIGFMVVDPAKLRDRFDEVGVLENIISRDKIKKYLMREDFQKEVDQLIQRYKENNVYSKLILDEIFLNLGLAMINISAFLDIEAIIISGGLGTSIGKLFAEKWEELLKKHVPFPPKLLFSELDNQEGVLGAVAVGIENIHKTPDELLI